MLEFEKLYQSLLKENSNNLNYFSVINRGRGSINKINMKTVLSRIIENPNFRKFWEKVSGDYISKAGTRKGFRTASSKWSDINYIDTNNALVKFLNSNILNSEVTLINIINTRVDRKEVEKELSLQKATITDVLCYFIMKNWNLKIKGRSIADILRATNKKGRLGERIAINYLKSLKFNVIELTEDEKQIDIGGIDFFIQKDGRRKSVQVKTNADEYDMEDYRGKADIIIEVDVKNKKVSNVIRFDR